jgi:hypothetical protein
MPPRLESILQKEVVRSAQEGSYVDNDTWEEIKEVEAQYANVVRVGYNAFEILFDFGKISGEAMRPRLQCRVITTPVIAQTLLKTLGKSLREYQHGFGEIPVDAEE